MVVNHIVNKHEGHSDKFKHCEHGPLAEERHWLKTGSKAHKVFMEVVGSAYLLRDLPQLSPVYQTYALEVFHHVVNHFASKSTHYFHCALMARMYIAALYFNENGNRALYFNENGNRDHAKDCDGNLRWKMVYPKPKKGEDAIIKPLKTQTTFNYVEELTLSVMERRIDLPSYAEARKDADGIFPVFLSLLPGDPL